MKNHPLRLAVFISGLIFLLPAAGPVHAQSIDASEAQCLGGQLDAPIRIDVFSDFQCPQCAHFYQETVRQILKDYSASNKVCVVYHEFPLAGHAHAREAARWSVAAQKIGRKQWLAVVEALYARQAEWSQSGTVELTASGVLSSDDYMAAKRFLLTPEVDQIVDRDIELGKKNQVTSTPTLFVNAIGRGQKVVGGLSYEVMKAFFDRIVK